MIRSRFLKLTTGCDITTQLKEEIEQYSNGYTEIIIPSGTYFISKTIKLHTGTHIRGSSELKPILKLVEKTNNNMFTNVDYLNGNSDIRIDNLHFDGNLNEQIRPDEEKRISFCNIFYFKGVTSVSLLNIKASNCKQTALHFNNCKDITIHNFVAKTMGWSGISTSGTNNIVAKNIYIYDSGKDQRHSAVHFDGGVGSYFEGTVEKCTGNGIMLDAKYSDFNKSVIKAVCIDCKRGVAIFGGRNKLNDVLLYHTQVINNEIGIMISNTKDIFISSCKILDSSNLGISFQGKRSVDGATIFDCQFERNQKNVDLINIRSDNYFLFNNIKHLSDSSHRNKYYPAKIKSFILVHLKKVYKF